jgi:hypothetical protein
MIIDKWKVNKHIPEIDLDVGGRVTLTMTKKSNKVVVNQQSYSIKDDETDKLFRILN